jgi:hypothetical protein
MFRPSTQPSSASRCVNAGQSCRTGPSFSLLKGSRTPMRRIRAGCCARERSGDTMIVAPASVMNARRRMTFPLAQARHRNELDQSVGSSRLGIDNVRNRSQPDMTRSNQDVRYSPKSGQRPHGIYECTANSSNRPLDTRPTKTRKPQRGCCGFRLHPLQGGGTASAGNF